MGRSQETFNKKEVRNKREKKKKEKEKRRQERKDSEKRSGLDEMIAYVDENGVITSTPPDPDKKEEIKKEDIEISVPKTQPGEEADTVRKGVVSFFNDSKGYGFIRDMKTRESLFFHVNNTLEDVKENNMVTFEVSSGPKGPTAVQVKLSK